MALPRFLSFRDSRRRRRRRRRRLNSIQPREVSSAATSQQRKITENSFYRENDDFTDWSLAGNETGKSTPVL